MAFQFSWRCGVLLAFLLLIVAHAPAAEKFEISGAAAQAQARAAAGKLIADYESYQLYTFEKSTPPLADGAQIQPRPEYDLILLNAGIIRTGRGKPGAEAAPAFSGRKMHLVQFAGPIKPEWLTELEQTGARVITYIPHNAYLVRADSDSLARLQQFAASADHVQWHGAYAAEHRIDPKAREKIHEEGRHLFSIQLVEDAALNRATIEFISNTASDAVERQWNFETYVNIVARLPGPAIQALAAKEDVVSIQTYAIPEKHDERQNQIVAGNISGNSPSAPGYLAWLTEKGFTQQQFTAASFAVDITDSGIDAGTTSPNHFGLYINGNLAGTSRVVYNRLEGSANSGSTIAGCDGHGTINAHIVGGYNNESGGHPHRDSAGYRYGLGVCPFVKVGGSVIFDPNNFTNPNYANLQSRAYRDGARISTNSWGANVSGAYNSDAQAYDALVRDAQPAGSAVAAAGNQEMVIVFSSGNAGPGAGTVGSPGTAKNVITVGASENVHSHSTANGGNNTAGNDGCNTPDTEANSLNDMATFSSRGPCQDGRAKPDLVAPGTHITGGAPQDSPAPLPTITGNDLACFNGTGVCGLPGGGTTGDPDNFFPSGQQFYTTSSGTSHSCPAVAGGCALLRQFFINLGLAPPSPAMTKAYLMNSARHMNGAGANDTFWSQAQGMGLMDLGAAFEGTSRILRDQLSADKFTASGQMRTFTATIPDPSKPVRITLAWTDAPGSTTGAAAKNNLDLRVTAAGNVYNGNRFSGALSTTGGSADALNNVESVFLPAGTATTVSVTVVATNINSDGVPNETPSLDQDFALVVYNAISASVPVITAEATTLVSEGSATPNGAVDPNELVTVSFALKNVGTLNTTNLVATLLPTGGVRAPSAAQNYGALTAGGSAVSRQFSFTPTGPCGGTITATLQLQDGAQALGNATFSIRLGKPSGGANPTMMLIPSSGAASPYPSTISLSGAPGTITKARAVLRGLTHPWPDDLDILLVGPGGQNVLLMSDAGGSATVNNITLTFEDGATSLPNNSLITSGTYAPTNYQGGDSFPSPAPGGSYSSTLSVFNGTNPNGTWSLYVVDDTTGDSGNIGDGWELELELSQPLCSAPSANLGLSKTASRDSALGGEEVSYSLTVTNNGPDAASGIIVADTLPNGVSFVSSNPAPSSQAGNVLTLASAALASGSSANITITAAIANTTNGTVINNASTSAFQNDPISGNNTASASTAVQADTDGDGMPDQWEIANGLNPNDPADAGANSDADSFTNVEEYLAGTDPNDAESSLRITQIRVEGSDVKVKFTSVAGKNYRLRKRGLMTGTWQTVLASIAGTGGVVEVTDAGGASDDENFYRIELVQ